MNNDFFERRIKEQLESVNRPMSPEGWETVKKRLPVPWYLSFLREWGLLTMGGLIFTGLLGNLYYQFKNQQLIERLYEENSILKQDVATLRRTTSSSAQLVTAHQVDTVYIIKKMVVEHRYVSNTDENGYQLASTNASSERTKNQRLKKENLKKSPAQLSLEARGAKATDALAATTTEKPLEAQPTEAVPTEPTPNETTAKEDSLTTEPKPVAQLPTSKDTTAKAAPPLAKKTFKFPTPRVRVGVESEFGLRKIGVGPSVELFLSPNFSISAGLHAHSFLSQEYQTVKEYNAATGLDFVKQFADVIPPNDHLEEIEMHVSTVEMPIGFKYYLPLRRDFSLVFATSTNVDLRAFNQVKFEAYKDGAEQYLSVETKHVSKSFYEYTFGLGIQKKWKQGIAQVQPFANFSFRQPEYAVGGNNVFGIKASVWVEFGKK